MVPLRRRQPAIERQNAHLDEKERDQVEHLVDIPHLQRAHEKAGRGRLQLNNRSFSSNINCL